MKGIDQHLEANEAQLTKDQQQLERLYSSLHDLFEEISQEIKHANESFDQYIPQPTKKAFHGPCYNYVFEKKLSFR
jgi:hypothetical protein